MLSDLVSAVSSAVSPCRSLDSEIWKEIDPVAAYQGGKPPCFTDDPNAAKLILPEGSALLISRGNRALGFEAIIILHRDGDDPLTISVRHPANRFLAVCLAALQFRLQLDARAFIGMPSAWLTPIST
jgi:hypothetical protein